MKSWTMPDIMPDALCSSSDIGVVLSPEPIAVRATMRSFPGHRLGNARCRSSMLMTGSAVQAMTATPMTSAPLT